MTALNADLTKVVADISNNLYSSLEECKEAILKTPVVMKCLSTSKYEALPDLLQTLLDLKLADLKKEVVVFVGYCPRGGFNLSNGEAFTSKMLHLALDGTDAKKTKTLVFSNVRPLCVTNNRTDSFKGCASHTASEKALYLTSLKLFNSAVGQLAHLSQIVSVVAISAAAGRLVSGNEDLDVVTEYADIVPPPDLKLGNDVRHKNETLQFVFRIFN